ncbi:MAG: hypothetical protein ABJP02_10895 [Parasphingorhabdus sp.]|uniref:hypothetical protein n=1 Tax=Parasphingorhabdus sp. TaxID=2709688 RepID=UPI003297E101
MLTLFETRDRRVKDLLEVRRLHTKYGDELVAVLGKRASDRSMDDRDRRHWKRILRKAHKYTPPTPNRSTAP